MDFHTKTTNEVLQQLQTNQTTGLTNKEAQKRLHKYGPNSLPTQKKKSLISHFLSQFEDFMILVLIAAAAVSFFASLLEGKPNFVDPVIILSIIVLNACLGVFQEYKAERSIDALKKLSAPNAIVLREQKTVSIPVENLVPGDIILLEAGNFIPADARLLSATSLKIDESALTGESLPIEKHSEQIYPSNAPLAERTNLVYSSSIITNGHGIAVVTKTGLSTEIGTIAKMILSEDSVETPLQKKLSQTGKILGIAAVIICIVIFVIGILEEKPILEMFLTSVSLAVAAIPEGLPSIVTIMLSLGVQRMAKKNAVLRSLPAVETLGNTTVICSDKTGTLTQNKMAVKEFYTANGKQNLSYSASFALTLCALCNNSHTTNVDSGDPLELALLIAAEQQNNFQSRLESLSKRQVEFPFDSSRKCMTTIYSSNSIFPKEFQSTPYLSITKGAPDVLLQKCNTYYENNTKKMLTSSIRQQILNYNNNMTSKALRVIAITCRPLSQLTPDQKADTFERDLTFVGLFGLLDPPRPEVPHAIETCHQAGIRMIMITGDHALTAQSIGTQIGITTQKKCVITGQELDQLSDQELYHNIDEYTIFARVSPSHKVRIIHALQKKENIVAMTGDGVNDAPALKKADIGCAMGKSGTDVAKNAADMILLDDNFSTIVEAVREGRGIYDNIRKAIHFLLSSNIGELMTIFTAILFGLSIPLLPVQLLWINLITDSLPAIALGMEPPEENIMNRPPTPRKNTLFSDGLGIKIVLEGLLIGALALLAYTIGCKYCENSSLILGRTMCFGVLSLSQLFHSFNMKSQDYSLFHTKLFNNPTLILSFFTCQALLIAVMTIPFLTNIFQVTPLSFPQWSLVFSLSFFPIVFVELQKKMSSMVEKQK